MTDKFAFGVFLSNSSKDGEVVRPLADRLGGSEPDAPADIGYAWVFEKGREIVNVG